MTPERIRCWLAILIGVEIIIITGFIWATIFTRIIISIYPSPEVIYYFQNCNNLTLYPQGCQVLS